MRVLENIDVRIQRDAAWQAQFAINSTKAAEIVRKLHIAHVTGHLEGTADAVGPLRSLVGLVRHTDGILPLSNEIVAGGRTYCNEIAIRTEEAMGLGSSLYFYIGRVHPEFGEAAFAYPLADICDVDGDATPFDTGGLFAGFICFTSTCGTINCVNKATCAKINPIDPSRIQRCIPDEVGLKTFMDKSRSTSDGNFSLSEIVKLFTEYLAAYFSEPGDYWDNQKRPFRNDPDSIFLHPRNEDFRAWTFEVRVHEPQRIEDCAAWGVSANMWNQQLRPLARHANANSSDPLLSLLSRTPVTIRANFAEEMEQWIRDRAGV